MESNFHSRVLQRPQMYDDQQQQDDDRRRGSRDILHSVASAAHQTTNNGPVGPRSVASKAFSLRSPTQPESRSLPPHFGVSSQSPSSTLAPRNANTNSHQIPQRPVLHNPFMPSSSTTAPSLPPPLQAPAAAAASSAASSTGGSSSLQPPPSSPLHAPPVYYPHDIRDRESGATGSFYDPTTDRTTVKTDRRISEAGSSSWHGSQQMSTPKVRLKINPYRLAYSIWKPVSRH